MRLDEISCEIDGEIVFRPTNHPLLKEIPVCPKCGSRCVSLPGYPSDYFDCEACEHSWPMTDEQKAKMIRSN